VTCCPWNQHLTLQTHAFLLHSNKLQCNLKDRPCLANTYLLLQIPIYCFDMLCSKQKKYQRLCKSAMSARIARLSMTTRSSHDSLKFRPCILNETFRLQAKMMKICANFDTHHALLCLNAVHELAQSMHAYIAYIPARMPSSMKVRKGVARSSLNVH
jgi:hypothetical protein